MPEIGVMIQQRKKEKKKNKEKKTCFNAHFQYSQRKIRGLK